MMASGLEQFFNYYLSPNLIGCILLFETILVFYLSIWQRTHSEMNLTKNKTKSFWGITFNQIATYFDILMSILFFVDAIEILNKHNFILPTVFSILFLTNLGFRKIGIYLSYNKVLKCD